MSAEKDEGCPQCDLSPVRVVTLRNQGTPIWIGCVNCLVRNMLEFKRLTSNPCKICGSTIQTEIVCGQRGSVVHARACSLHFHARELLTRSLKAVRTLQDGGRKEGITELCGDLQEILGGSRG